MKILGSFFVFIILSSSLFAQGTLQFNQVLLVNSLSTVPAGKVWKVEGFMYNGGAPFASGVANFVFVDLNNWPRGFFGLASFNVNGQAVVIPAAFNHPGGYLTSPTAMAWFPMWLPASTTIQPITNIRYFNVIEFNIIP
jgi:hypothetical protein